MATIDTSQIVTWGVDPRTTAASTSMSLDGQLRPSVPPSCSYQPPPACWPRLITAVAPGSLITWRSSSDPLVSGSLAGRGPGRHHRVRRAGRHGASAPGRRSSDLHSRRSPLRWPTAPAILSAPTSRGGAVAAQARESALAENRIADAVTNLVGARPRCGRGAGGWLIWYRSGVKTCPSMWRRRAGRVRGVSLPPRAPAIIISSAFGSRRHHSTNSFELVLSVASCTCWSDSGDRGGNARLVRRPSFGMIFLRSSSRRPSRAQRASDGDSSVYDGRNGDHGGDDAAEPLPAGLRPRVDVAAPYTGTIVAAAQPTRPASGVTLGVRGNNPWENEAWGSGTPRRVLSGGGLAGPRHPASRLGAAGGARRG
jgi:hypothetical protein